MSQADSDRISKTLSERGAMYRIYELQEAEYWEDVWNSIGLYMTQELAEQARDRRAAMLRSEFDEAVGKFEDWYAWNIRPRELSGNPRQLEYHSSQLAQ